ncbi:PREDICTED: core-binding factor subunit beta-like, partial [Priapulus caudatus]|uniref:Core-binding factor subunit beta-like n=1 Tax=Priapulus caudatus TaxID=37621 RepID=A0ABM1EC14_PRICU
MDGVCVLWRGYIDVDSLNGIGKLEFDEETAQERERERERERKRERE